MGILQTVFDKSTDMYNRLQAAKKQAVRTELDKGLLSSLCSSSFAKFAARDFAQAPFAAVGMATILVAKAARVPLDTSKLG